VAGLTGRGVTVGVIDSGINPGHPHVHGVAGGIALGCLGGAPGNIVDRLGHGTAVAAAIHEKAPDAVLFAVKVFDGELRASILTLAAAIDWAVEQELTLVNLSLGTARVTRAAMLRPAVQRAIARGMLVVSAAEHEGVSWLPGNLPGVVRVALDWTCERDRLRIIPAQDGVPTFHASGYPRPIPGVPPDRNLKGVSFAVANVTGFLARLLERYPGVKTPGELWEVLCSTAESR
jgi:hypothetical protein